jgi:hypothetical protein
MRPLFRSLFACTAFAALCFVQTNALAAGVSPIGASPELKQKATNHFVAGKQARAAKDFRRAIAELSASIEVVDSPNAHLELARALRDSGQLGEAWTEYWHAAEAATRLAPQEERYAKTADAATNEREDVARQLAFVQVSVAHAPADGTLTAGGRVIASDDWGGPVVVEPGQVDVIMTNAAGAELARATVTATVGQTIPVSLEAQPAPAPVAASPVPAASDTEPAGGEERPATFTPPPEPPSGRAKLRTVAYVSGGVGLAGIATFAIFGLMSNSTYHDLQNTCPLGCLPAHKGEVDSGALQQTVANVGLVAGIAGLALGTTLFFVSAPTHSTSAPAAALVVGPGFAGIRGSL